MPSEQPHVSGVMLRALADVAMQHDVAPATLLQETSECFRAREPLQIRLPLSEFRALLKRAIELTGEPSLGLRCGLHASESAFDLLAPLVAHVPTLREAIGVTRRFQDLALEGARLELGERAGVASMRWGFPRAHDVTDSILAEFLTGGLVRMFKAFGGGANDLYAVRFEHPQPSHHRAYASAFGGKECFAQPFTGLEFAARLLDRPHLHANPAVQSLAHAQVEQRVLKLSQPESLVERLRLHFLSQPPSHVPDMQSAARAIGLSVRSLRRRLTEQDLSYRELIQEMQCERACALLRDPARTLQSVADALGFADAASFHRAFKRWTGMTPSQYREAQTAEPGTGRWG